MSGTRLPPNLGAHSRRVTELFRPLPLAERLADSLILLLRYVDAAGIAAYAASSSATIHCIKLAPLLAYEAAARWTSVETPSTDPLVRYAPEFLSRPECEALIALGRVASASPFGGRVGARRLGAKHYVQLSLAPEFHPRGLARLLSSIDHRARSLTGCPAGDAFELNFTPVRPDVGPRTAAEAGVTLDSAVWWLSSGGVHVDSNNGFPHRYATVLAYLNDTSGGATCFPAAGTARAAKDAAVRLLSAGYTHTDSAVRQDEDEGAFDDACTLLESGSRLMLDDVRPHGGVRVQPKAGAAAVFWSLGDDGAVDPASWHGGARVVGGEGGSYFENGKWTLQSFRQLPENKRDAEDRADFVRRSRRREGGEGGGLRWELV
mgnify:FL=1